MLGLGLGLTNFGTRGGVSDVPDALSGASSLLKGEDGLAIDFSDQSIAIRDTTTPANNISSAGTVRNGAIVGPGAKITYTSPSPKLTLQGGSSSYAGYYAYQAHNLITYSEDISNVAWSPLEVTVTGTDTVTETTTGSAHSIWAPSVAFIAGATYVFSAEIKSSSETWVQLLFASSAFGTTAWENFQLSGSGGTGNGGSTSTPSITSVGDGWYRCTITATCSTTASTVALVSFTNNTDTATRGLSYAGATDSSMQVRKAHVYRYPANTDYIKTTSAPLYDLPYDWTGTYYYPLFEPSATNICLHSNDLTQSNWTKTSSTAAKTATGPDGVANSASTLTASAANGVAVQNISSASATRSGSVFLKRRTGTGAVSIAIGETTGSELVSNGTFAANITGWTAYGTSLPTLSHTGSALLVTNTGTTAGRGAGQAITCVVGKLYRVTATLTAVSGTTAPRLYVGTNALGQSNLGSAQVAAGNTATFCFVATATTVYISLNDQGVDATSTLTWDDVSVLEVSETTVDLSSGAWVRATIENKTITNPCVAIKLATSGDAVDVAYAQMEIDSVATSPIITAGATVTRAADNLSVPTSAFPFNAAAVTMFVEADTYAASHSEHRTFLQLDDGSTNNKLSQFANAITNLKGFFVGSGGGTSAFISDGTITADTPHKFAASAAANDFMSSIDGVLGTPDTSGSMPSGITTLRLGADFTANREARGHIRKVMVLPRAMTDAALTTLTGGTPTVLQTENAASIQFNTGDEIAVSSDINRLSDADIDGTEWVVVVQGGVTKKASVETLKDYLS